MRFLSIYRLRTNYSPKTPRSYIHLPNPVKNKPRYRGTDWYRPNGRYGTVPRSKNAYGTGRYHGTAVPVLHFANAGRTSLVRLAGTPPNKSGLDVYKPKPLAPGGRPDAFRIVDLHILENPGRVSNEAADHIGRNVPTGVQLDHKR
jgi:hypothetical protein